MSGDKEKTSLNYQSKMKFCILLYQHYVHHVVNNNYTTSQITAELQYLKPPTAEHANTEVVKI